LAICDWRLGIGGWSRALVRTGWGTVNAQHELPSGGPGGHVSAVPGLRASPPPALQWPDGTPLGAADAPV
jgi:hypothetical protein